MNKAIKNRITVFIVILISIIGYGQQISAKLDSIHKLSESDYDKLELYYSILDQYQKDKDYTQLGYDAHQLAKWIHKEKKWDTAIEIVEIAYKAREKASPYDLELLKRSYYNYAIYNQRKENHTIAIQYFQKMLNLGGTDFLRGRAYGLVGESYDEIGDSYSSIENHLQAFPYFNSKAQEKYLIANHINISVTYKNIRTKESAIKALKHLQIADSIIKNKNKLKSSYLINTNLAGLYYEGVSIRDPEKTKIHLEEALKRAKEINNSHFLCNTYYNLGIAYIEEKPVLAKRYFNKSLKLSNKYQNLTPRILTGLGMVAHAEKDYSTALKHYKNSFSSYFNTTIYNLKWLPEKRLLDKITNKALFLEFLKRKILTHLALAKQTQKLSDYHEAIDVVKTSDQLIDIILKEDLSYKTELQWRSLASEIYILGLEACYQSNRISDAHYFMEKNKSLLLIQELNKKKINIPEIVLEKEKELEQKIIDQQNFFLTAQNNQKDSISEVILNTKSTLKKFKDSLSTDYPSYFFKKNLPKIVSINDIKIKSSQVIIQYVMAERVAEVLPEAYGLVLFNDQKVFFKLENIKELLDNIYTLRKQLSTPFKNEEDIAAYKKTAYQLYTSLIPMEVRTELKNKKATIITDHMISMIPFEALVTDIDSGRYLIEDSQINYTYSLSFQKENTTVSRNAEKEFLGIAPVQFSDGLTSLNQSKTEISTANTYYDGSLLIKEKATKENFIKEARNYKILHLATHADASDSIAPWIAFHDEKLTDLELNVIPNEAELVVLSACNTSLGEVRRGEGVLSLARGFFKSGANTVVPSLWNTNDKATATITGDFYKNLSEGKTKSEALHLAKLNYLHSNEGAEASPHYWAPLVLIGDTSTLIPESNGYWIWLLIGVIVLIIVMFSYRSFKTSK
ncbi:CHAT domain-containing tetratricopeptide repeat protein [Aquimarina sp. 2201CG5-10]|uniref:CHAT domain-containing protein n=1 Tax=Aquimarina callyspongiae TaxID=3098150 RepID=UPI002AB57117|nr:CHAT domain-containing tetratricopeptide repeat protein [Aquimarina sp. 2201CG5-10]MDY8137837.1 CHAT domain-containing tetratricopeptide repeat protein [Aquimarina sp. 2201CG5-10]